MHHAAVARKSARRFRGNVSACGQFGLGAVAIGLQRVYIGMYMQRAAVAAVHLDVATGEMTFGDPLQGICAQCGDWRFCGNVFGGIALFFTYRRGCFLQCLNNARALFRA